MAIYSKFLQLMGGYPRTVDLSGNTLSVGGTQLNGSSSGSLTIIAAATTSTYTLTMPSAVAGAGQVLTDVSGNGTLSWQTPASSGANTALSNLTTTAINVSLLPGTSASLNIGSTSETWLNGYIANLNDASNNPDLQVFNRLAFDSGGTQSIDWQNRLLRSNSSTTQASWSSSGFTIGAAATTQGNLIFANSTNSLTTTINAAATTGSSYNFNLPSSAGSAGQVLTSQGGGASAMTWTTPGTGTVTSVSVTTANGFAGTVATSTTTPAITISTSVTGLLKGNGTAVSAATAGTDYVIPSGSITGTAGNITATSNSTLTTLSALSLPTSQLSGTVSLTTQASGTLQAGQFPALTGDITTTAGSLATTLATVNSNTGSFGSSTAIPTITVNAKGLITAVSTNAVVAPAGTLSGTTLNSTVVTSSLTSLGTQSQALNMGTNQINNLAMAGSPAGTDATNVTYVNAQISAAINGLTWKGPVNAFANSNVALTGGATLTIDSYSVQNGNYVILAAQTTTSQNGVYLASGIGSSYTLTAASGSEAATALGDAYLILDGTVYGGSAVQVNGLSPTTFIQFAGPNTYSFTTPLLLTGNVVSIGYDNSTIGVTSNQLVVKTGGIGTTQLAASGVTYAKIQNVTASRLLGNPTGGSAAPSEISLGSTLTFSGSALQTTAMSGDVTTSANSFATTIAAGAVTATKLGSVTDGTTLDQSGAGSTIEIKTGGVGTTQLAAAAVTSAKVATGVFDQATITGGAGTPAAVAYAPARKQTATYGGVTTLAANTTYALRWGIPNAVFATFTIPSSSITAGTQYTNNGQTFTVLFTTASSTTLTCIGTGAPTSTGTLTFVSGSPSGNLSFSASTSTAEVAGELYIADWNTAAFNQFLVVGLYNSTSTTSTGASITVTRQGPLTLGSSDTTFSTSNQGAAVWLGAFGTYIANSAFSPATGDTNFILGTAQISGIIDVNPMMLGIN